MNSQEPSGETSTNAPPAAPQKPAQPHAHPQSFWLWIMCLTGVDYFSTLGYQPSIAFSAAGLLAPLATVVLVLLTLFGALPVYNYVASRSPHGQGSISMLERLMRGWVGKVIVLTLLGFAATDFVITKTLSAADAAEHMIHNPLWKHVHSALPVGAHYEQILVTVGLLVLLGAVFMRGFREVIGMAVVIVAVYLLLNGIIIGSGVYHLVTHPDLFQQWLDHLTRGEWYIEHRPLDGTGWLEGTSLLTMIGISLLIFPKLALGLSGFETGVAVMPLIRGDADDEAQNPVGRIRNTRHLMRTAAIIMSVLLLGSSMVVATLINPLKLGPDGPAANRALAFLAHGQGARQFNPLFGDVFGTIYDISTVMILGFAGASAMAGLLNLVPQYLPRYGMAPEWARAARPLVIMFTLINLFVTWMFSASVEAQGGAYATGVLVLISSACIATVIDQWRTRKAAGKVPLHPGYALVTAVFVYTTIANMVERPDGLKIASFFILAIIAASVLSRVFRSKELRFRGFDFVDSHSRFLWDSLKLLEFPVLVPHRPGRHDLAEKEQLIRERHRLTPDIPVIFLEVRVGDPSEFEQVPILDIYEQEGRFVVRLTRCSSVAHVIAALALELSRFGKPPEIHFGWSDEAPLEATFNFLVFGEGNVPSLVRDLVRRAEPNLEKQPSVIVG